MSLGKKIKYDLKFMSKLQKTVFQCAQSLTQHPLEQLVTTPAT